MASVEKLLEAAQRFLRGVLSLPSYEDIQTKQLKGLLHCLDKVKDLSTAQAGMFLDALDPELWSEEKRGKSCDYVSRRRLPMGKKKVCEDQCKTSRR